MKTLFVMALIQGASLMLNCVGFFLVQACRRYLESPSWTRKQWAWVLLIASQASFLVNTFAHPRARDWWDLLYSGLFLLAVAGFVDSYRLLLVNLSRLSGSSS